MAKSREFDNIFGAYRFRVEIDGLQVAGFTEVTGLEMDTEMMEYHEGGVNSFVHQFPVVTRQQKLVLRRGISDYTTGSLLWDWYSDCIRGKITKKDGSVILNDQSGYEVCRWNFFYAQPVSWKGPEFHSLRSEIAIESIELVHEGLKLVYETDYDTSLLFND